MPSALRGVKRDRKQRLEHLAVPLEVILKRFSEEKKEFLERLDDSDVGITSLLAVVRGMTPYVPRNKRMEIIVSANLSSRESDVLRVMAETAPDLVAEENNKRLELLREEHKKSEEALRQAMRELRKHVSS